MKAISAGVFGARYPYGTNTYESLSTHLNNESARHKSPDTVATQLRHSQAYDKKVDKQKERQVLTIIMTAFKTPATIAPVSIAIKRREKERKVGDRDGSRGLGEREIVSRRKIGREGTKRQGRRKERGRGDRKKGPGRQTDTGGQGEGKRQINKGRER
jgi:hypothetical protein